MHTDTKNIRRYFTFVPPLGLGLGLLKLSAAFFYDESSITKGGVQVQKCTKANIIGASNQF